MLGDRNVIEREIITGLLMKTSPFDSGWIIPSRTNNNVITIGHGLGQLPSEVRVIIHDLDNNVYYIHIGTNASAYGNNKEYQNPLSVLFDDTYIYLHIYQKQYLYQYWSANSGWKVGDNVRYKVLAWR